MKPDPRVDAYIAKAAAFAQPLLVEMRKRIHKAIPGATETIKWNVPFYVQNGKLVASMAAFKHHTKFGVWQNMMPAMLDVAEPSELPPSAEYAKQLKAAVAVASAGAKKASSRMPAKKAPAKKAPAKKAPAKKAPAKKRK